MPPADEFADALPAGPVRGRGAGLNPLNRFESTRLHVLGEHRDRVAAGEEETARPTTQIIPDQTRRILNRLDPETSPDIGFRWTMNPYRGCEHGCIYCFARPDHERLGMSSGLDFETKIVAKHEAPALLRRELAHPSWRGDPILFAGVTDIYQPIERELRITRRCLEVLAEARQPVGMITKNRLITRDLDLLGELARHQAVHAAISVTTLDARLASKMEPRASSPGDRLRAIEELTAIGVPVRVMVAPVIPGLTDREIPAILRAAGDAGAVSAGYVMLRLPYQVKALFLEWLERHFPQRAAHVESLIREVRGGKLYDARWGVRGRGEGPIAEHVAGVFKLFARRYGLDRGTRPLCGEAFRPPSLGGQGSLF